LCPRGTGSRSVARESFLATPIEKLGCADHSRNRRRERNPPPIAAGRSGEWLRPRSINAPRLPFLTVPVS
jgi:hypothetical protein